MATHGNAVRGRSKRRRRRWNVGRGSKFGTGTGGTECRGKGNAVARERPRVKPSRWAVHGDEEVAAGERSMKSWRARERAAGERKEVRAGSGRRVEVDPAGGGAAAALERRQRCSAAGGRKQSRGPRARGGRREGRGPGDLLVISEKFRDLSVN
jgi:hypothetical protein